MKLLLKLMPAAAVRPHPHPQGWSTGQLAPPAAAGQLGQQEMLQMLQLLLGQGLLGGRPAGPGRPDGEDDADELD